MFGFCSMLRGFDSEMQMVCFFKYLQFFECVVVIGFILNKILDWWIIVCYVLDFVLVLGIVFNKQIFIWFIIEDYWMFNDSYCGEFSFIQFVVIFVK